VNDRSQMVRRHLTRLIKSCMIVDRQNSEYNLQQNFGRKEEPHEYRGY